MDTYIGRQPIFDTDGRCIAYELLYRNAIDSAGAHFSDDGKATARVMINLVHNIGLSAIIGERLGFINVDEKIVMSDLMHSLPKEKSVFEILEYTRVTPEFIDKVADLHAM